MKKIVFIIFVLIQNLGFSQNSNIDFELASPGVYSASNAVSGWTLSSQTATCGTASAWTPGSSEFSIVSTPILSFPTVGNIGASPLGGTKVARLNNSTANSSRTKLAYTFSVSPTSVLIACAVAGVWEGATSHQCCAQTGFQITLKDQFGTVLSCSNYSFAPGVGCASANSTFSTSSTTAWTNWQLRNFGLNPWVNSLVTVEVSVTDCAFGDHFGTLFFDAKIGLGTYWPLSGLSQCNPVNYCNGSNIAQLSAPIGYLSYQWISPVSGTVAAPQGTLSTLTVTNPIANSVYSVMLQSASGCTFISTLAIVPSTVSILAYGSTSSCAGGASGSATVATCGSGTGYNFAWYNSTNSLVGTGYTVTNLSPGTYSVVVTAAGSESVNCGIASSTVTIGTNTNTLIQALKPYCNNGAAYLSYPGGTNYQWYSNLGAISASLGGSASGYTVSNPTNGSNYYLTYTSAQSCQDSLKITLVSVPPGSLNIVSNPIVCPGATNGSVTLNMFSAPGAPPGNNWYTMISTGTTPVYSVSINPGASNTFTAGGLAAGGTYSINAFDGVCRYNKSFTITPYLFDYTLTPGNTPTVCNGDALQANINFAVPPAPSQYTYSWTPGTFLNGTNSINAIIVPTVNPGGSATINYTVVVTPSLINCPLSKTMAIIVANPLTPSISPISNLCSNSSNYTIQAQPAGGIFINGSSMAIDVNTGVLSPSLAAKGLNTFTYANSIGTCVAQSTATFFINSPPQISISGDTAICAGQSTTLTASGASSYSWSNIGTNPVISVSPAATAVYLVTGTDVSSNCSSTASVTVSVFPNPTLNVSGDTTICGGEITILNVSGADTYTWNPGNITSSFTVSPNQTTQYTVAGTSLQGYCTSTMQIQVTVSACLGMENISAGNSTVHIFPNPNQGIFYLESERLISVSIADVYGKVIFENNFEAGVHIVDLRPSSGALYFVKVFDASNAKVFKLIKSD